MIRGITWATRVDTPWLARRYTNRAPSSNSHSSSASREPSLHPPSPQIEDPLTPPVHSSRLFHNLPRLRTLANRTGVPLPSLGISFLILHEVTAFVPLVAFFFVFQALGAGAGLVAWIASVASQTEDGGVAWKQWVGGWYEEGQKRVERVGARYGVLGYEKVVHHQDSIKRETKPSMAAEKVANAIAAYVTVKVGVSPWLPADGERHYYQYESLCL